MNNVCGVIFCKYIICASYVLIIFSSVFNCFVCVMFLNYMLYVNNFKFFFLIVMFLCEFFVFVFGFVGVVVARSVFDVFSFAFGVFIIVIVSVCVCLFVCL